MYVRKFDNTNKIYKNLLRYRKEAGLSQRAMSAEMMKLGIPMYQQMLGKIERNERYVLEEEVRGFCQILKVSPEDLLMQEGAD